MGMRKTGCLAIAIGLCLVLGCQGLGYPHLLRPGSAPYQQEQAVRFDPFPEPDVGPDIPGLRPPGYQMPIAEPQRARWTLPNFER